MAAAAADVSIRALHDGSWRTGCRYEAQEMVPVPQGPLNQLQRKHTAELATLQVSSGIFSVGIGLMFAFTTKISLSLITMFRLSYVTGLMFAFTGCVSNQLLRRPGLLHSSLVLNAGCVVVASVAAALMVADLANPPQKDEYFKMECLEFCLLLVETFISSLLCFFFSREERSRRSRAAAASS